jgi:quercetin dioxygenase-like cupin family protein
MAIDQLTNTHPTGKTTGTAQRRGQDHEGVALTFDIASEIARLQQEETWTRSGRNSRTLAKEPNLRVVLITMQAGTQILEHRAAARLSVQVISGHLRLQVPDQDVDLPAGHLLVLDHSIGYEIHALDTSAFLLTVAWDGAYSK